MNKAQNPRAQSACDPAGGATATVMMRPRKPDGEVRQSGSTIDFIFPLDVVIRHIARMITLLPGDLVATGTPQGVGPVVAGDVMEVSVEGVGTLRNNVQDEEL